MFRNLRTLHLGTDGSLADTFDGDERVAFA